MNVILHRNSSLAERNDIYHRTRVAPR